MKRTFLGLAASLAIAVLVGCSAEPASQPVAEAPAVETSSVDEDMTTPDGTPETSSDVRLISLNVPNMT